MHRARSTIVAAFVVLALGACGDRPGAAPVASPPVPAASQGTPAAPPTPEPPATQSPPAIDPGIVETPPARVDPQAIERPPANVDPGILTPPPKQVPAR